MRISGPWIARPETQGVCAVLVKAGHRALFVGGCVRNALLGAEVADVDIATDALPETVMDLAARAGLRPVPTGIEHGTVTVVSGGLPHEVTTFRRDVQTDGRHAIVAFTDDVAADAARRDFTMNALYATPDGEVIDPLGGLVDLHARRLRFVGDPEARIAEDHLRILRFFRFHAWYGGNGLDADGLAACAAGADGLDTLSRERVGGEIRKLLAAPDPAPAVAAMSQTGILARILPGAASHGLAQLISLELEAGPDWLRRLAVIGGEDAADRLRLSRQEARDLAVLRDAVSGMDTPAVLGWRLGAARGWDAVAIRSVLTGASLPPNCAAELSRGAFAKMPVRAEDLMPDLQGAALGARLKAVEDDWIESDLRKSRDELLG